MRLRMFLGLLLLAAFTTGLTAQTNVNGTGGGAFGNSGAAGFAPNSPASVEVDFDVNLPAGEFVESVEITVNLVHAWVGDVVMELEAPDGRTHGLIVSPIGGGGNDAEFGDVGASTGFNYTFTDTATESLWDVTMDPIPAGNYRTTNAAGDTDTSIDAEFAGMSDAQGQGSGTWILRITDVFPSIDGGIVDAAASSISITTSTTLPQVDPEISVAYHGGTPLADGGTIVVYLDSTVADLDLELNITDLNTGDELSLTADVDDDADIDGFVQSEWNITQQGQPVTPATPTSGVFNMLGTIVVTLDGTDDAGGTDQFVFFIDVVEGNGDNFLGTRWDGVFRATGAAPSAVMFDVDVTNPIEVTDFYAVFLAAATDVEIWYRTGTHVGSEDDDTDWTLHETLSAVAGQGLFTPTRLELTTPISLSGGTLYGFAIISDNTPEGPFYTTGVGGNYSDANIEIILGSGVANPFDGGNTGVFSPRAWNGAIVYDLGPPAIQVERPAGTDLGGSPAADGLGNVMTGGATQFTWTIRNIGALDLDVTDIEVSNVVDADVSPTNPALDPTGDIGMGDTATFSLNVTPDDDEPFSFTITITSNADNFSSFVINVTGTGVDNEPPVLELGTNSTFDDNADFSLDVDPGETLADAVLDASDADGDDFDITVAFDSGPGTGAPSGITAPMGGTGFDGTQTHELEWTGTADASNVPGTYTWTVTLDDGINTPVVYNVNITIADLPPEHTPAAGVSGDGSSGDPYLASYAQGDEDTMSTNLANVTDPNTGQTLSIDDVTQTSGPTAGSGFDFTLSGGVLSVAPADTLTADDAGVQVFEVEITDGNNTTSIFVEIDVASATGNITFDQSSPLDSGRVGSSYSVTLTASGGDDPYTFAVIAGTLPPGLSLDAGGEISGEPTTTGTFNFTVRVTDDSNDTATEDFEIEIRSRRSSSSDDGCSTGHGGGQSWLLLIGLFAAMLAGVRVARQRVEA
jgi:hypothetical protein